MRVLVTGAGGMVGREVVRELQTRGHEAVPVTRQEFDIADPTSAARLIAGDLGKLDAVINCAAYTAVDKAESEEQAATNANGFGVAYLGTACLQLGLALIHVSTDFVFDGRSDEAYIEDAPANPASAYGRSKLHGERSLISNPYARIVRTAWLFSPEGRCFPRTMVQAYRAGKSLRVVADQRGNPTYVPDLARVLVDLLEKNAFPGVYHAVGPETTTWHDFAVRAIRAATGETPEIAPVTTEEFPTPAVRPKNSALADTRLGPLAIEPMRSLDEALKDWVERASFE
ncbi:dTDP-4-dehydrorhamnose reductase [bacterium]|nr:MAG: dTDP-4-dehydrorhamnose reductase [bacterium]